VSPVRPAGSGIAARPAGSVSPARRLSRLGRGGALLACCSALGCRVPDVATNDPDLPGFAPCATTHLDDVRYAVCSEQDWPVDGVTGRLVGVPAVFGEPAAVQFVDEPGTAWPLTAEAGFEVAFDAVDWWAEDQADAPTVTLRILGRCADPDYAFSVEDEAGLLALGGLAPAAAAAGFSADASEPSSRCDDAQDCPCGQGCVSQSVRFSHPDGELELHPGESGPLGEQHLAYVFEGWRSEDPACAAQAQRWLVLRQL
jgi:hypothetical protein